MKVLIFLVFVLLLLISPAYAQSDCGLESRLEAGGAGQVTPGEANNVRDEAARSGVLLGQIEGGQPFGVLEGPRCGGGLTWWQVEYIDGGEVLTGWTVESTTDTYFVDPLEGIFVSAADGNTGISLVLPPDIATAAKVTIEEGSPVHEDDQYAYSPAYIEISITEGYPDEVTNAPSITVFASDAFEDDHTMFGDAGNYAVEGIGTLLEERPDLTMFDAVYNELPDFSPGVAMMLLAYLDYLDFSNGTGIRYLSYYAQDFVSPDNGNLVYRYQGMTDDSAYFIDGRMAIDAPALPPEFDIAAAFASGNDDDGFSAFAQYAADNAEFFESFPLEEYTPNLASLDALIASLWIESE